MNKTGANMRAFNLDKNQMPKLATVLKDEIVRMARKEVRAETSTLRKAATLSRTDDSQVSNQWSFKTLFQPPTADPHDG